LIGIEVMSGFFNPVISITKSVFRAAWPGLSTQPVDNLVSSVERCGGLMAVKRFGHFLYSQINIYKSYTYGCPGQRFAVTEVSSNCENANQTVVYNNPMLVLNKAS